jgi:serine/threonine protein phosphatase PrpC
MSAQPPVAKTFALRSEIDFDSQASIGARSGQEDYALFTTGRAGTDLLAVLADGMGGHSAGEVASKKAVDTFYATFSVHPAVSVPAKLGAALNQAKTDLDKSIKDSPALSGMGCTLVGAHIGPLGLQWISVGDSPLFLYRSGKLQRLNADHSMVPVIEEALREGKISKQEALSHPDRHALRSAISGDDLVLIDTSSAPLALRKGDVVVLASDGLLTLSEAEIVKVIKGHRKGTAQSLVNALINAVLAKKLPKQDNTTIQIVILPAPMGSEKNAGLWLTAGALLVLAIGLAAYAMKDLAFNWPKLPDLTTKPAIPVAPTPIVNDPPPVFNHEGAAAGAASTPLVPTAIPAPNTPPASSPPVAVANSPPNKHKGATAGNLPRAPGKPDPALATTKSPPPGITPQVPDSSQESRASTTVGAITDSVAKKKEPPIEPAVAARSSEPIASASARAAPGNAASSAK